MKKIIILAVTIILAALLSVLTVSGQTAEEMPTVYLDSINGSDSNDGLSEATATQTFTGAYTALQNSIGSADAGKIVLVNDYLYDFSTSTSAVRDLAKPTHKFHITITGKTPQTALRFYLTKESRIGMRGPTTFENMTILIDETSKTEYLCITGNGPLTMGEGITTSDTAKWRPSISAAPYWANSNSICDLQIYSGNWKNLYVGSYCSDNNVAANVTLNGGLANKIATNYSKNQTSDSTITVNGGTVNYIIGGAISSGTHTGSITINLNGGTVNQPIDRLGKGTVEGTTAVNVNANGLILLMNGTVDADTCKGSALTLGSSTVLNITGNVTGEIAVTVSPSIRVNHTYVTAPTATADSAFSFSQATMTVTTENGVKSWSNQDENAQFTGLVLRAPSQQTVKLYTGTKDGSLLSPDATETVDGIRYDYYANLQGTFRYVSSRSGYYTVTRVIYMTQSESLTETVVDAATAKRAGIGFEPTSVKNYSEEMLALKPSDETAPWWNDYSKYLITPVFQKDKAEHQATTQEEMENFLNSLEKHGNMYLYSIGKSGSKGYDIPMVIFTTTDLSSAETVEEAAALINANGKPTVHYQAQIHGNEPAAGEAALAVIARLNSEYGDTFLQTLNIYVIPRLNPDGSYAYKRNEVAVGLNMNRDMLHAFADETQAVHRVFALFNPELSIDSHEYTYQPEVASGAYNDMMIAGGYNARFCGDSAVLALIDSFGFNLQLSGMDTVVTKSLTGSSLDSSREYFLLLQNFDVQNHSETPVNAEVFLKLKDGTTITSASCSYSLRTMVETVSSVFETFTQTKKDALVAFVNQFSNIMKDWAIQNIA